jgi:hypothetical protein
MEREQMCGKFPTSLAEKLVDMELSYQWLEFGDIKTETGRTVVAAEDQTIQTILQIQF